MRSDLIEDVSVEKVIASYKDNGSIRRVASDVGISTVKVRKILITHGLWESRTSRRICDLYSSGMDTREIASVLDTTVNNVLAYTPYDRGIYLKEHRSADSLNSSAYRAQKKMRADSQVASYEGSRRYCSHSLIDECRIPFAVHIELDFGELDARERHILVDYGKCSNGRKITRDIVVPGDFSLYALHFAIQKLYGWTNGHLRRFYLPEEREAELTDGKLGKLFDLDGVLFRYPLEDEMGYFINDDYDERQSFNTWLRSKYTGPYDQIADVEDFHAQQELAEQFFDDYKTLDRYVNRKCIKVPSRDYPYEEFVWDMSPNDLLLRLPLAMVLAPDGTRLLPEPEWFENMEFTGDEYPGFPYVTDKLLYDYDYGDGWTLTITRPNEIGFSDRIFRDVVEQHAPVCIHRDGRMLLDDVGGIGGYLAFLDTVIGHHPDENYGYDDEADTLAWATGIHGWSKRNISLENLL